MTRLVVRDGSDAQGGGLNFDLAEILAAIGPRSVTSEWILRDLNYVSRDDREIPVFQVEDGSRISGEELRSSLPNLLQVIDGEFIGVEVSSPPWIVVRAVDSSWWEVLSEDAEILKAVRSRFKNVNEQV